MQNIILEPGSDPNSRGLFSFINQFLSVHRSCLYDKSVLISFDLICKSSYYDDNILTTKNAWEYFFEPKIIDNPAISSVIRTVWCNTGHYYGYTFDFSNQNEREIASKIISDNLILKNEISEEIEKFYETNFYGKRVLGVHKRGTDIGIHHRKRLIDEFFYSVDLIKNDYDLIFLTTDERCVVDAFKDKYPNIVYHSYDSLSLVPDKPNFKAKICGGYKIGKDAIIDAFLLSKCDFLLQTNSNLSNFSLLCNSNLNFKRI